MVLEKMIDELYGLSKKAIASGIHVSFEIGLAGYPCRVWVEEPPESKMTAYDIYREEVMMKESLIIRFMMASGCCWCALFTASLIACAFAIVLIVPVTIISICSRCTFVTKSISPPKSKISFYYSIYLFDFEINISLK